MTVYNETNTEGLTASGVYYVVFPVSIENTVTVTLSEDIIALASIIESTYMNDILTTAASFGFTVTDQSKLNDLILISLHSILSENISYSDDIIEVIKRVNIIRDVLNILDTSSTQKLSTIALAVSLSIADLLGQVDIVNENFNLDDSFIDLLKISFEILDNLEVSETSADYITFFQITTDILSVDETISLQSVFNRTLLDSFKLVIDSDILGGTYSGWVINPENYAVSNYSNYNFIGNTFYSRDNLYCNSTGLYKLEGTLDEASYIASRIKTATMAFGTSSLKQVNEALLGVNNTGRGYTYCFSRWVTYSILSSKTSFSRTRDSAD